MQENKSPTFANGKIYCVALSFRDIAKSSDFYQMETLEITTRFTDPFGSVLGIFQQ